MSSLNAKEVCSTIPGTLRIVKTSGCSTSTLCMGYAECINKKERQVGKILCKANSDGSCPDAESCLESTFTKHEVNISVQPQNKADGIFKYCNTKDKFQKSSANSDVVYSRICNVVSGDYSQKGNDDQVNKMTDTLGNARVK